jgi:hypothetical protein
MAEQTRAAVGKKHVTVLADSGYYSSQEILECDRAGIIPLLPKPRTSNNQANGLFDRRDFRYLPRSDEYRCPAGERAIWRFSCIEHGLLQHVYWPSACPLCPMKERCTPSEYRRIKRWEHEEVLEAMQRRLDRRPETSRLRRQTVEHVFGTLKAWMGPTHFLTKTLPRVRTEMSLSVLAYNLKRAIQILGVQPLIRAIAA